MLNFKFKIQNSKFKIKYCIVFLFFILIAFTGMSQQLYPLNRDMTQAVDENLINTNMSFHTENKPYIESELKKYINPDSVLLYKDRDDEFHSLIRSDFSNTVWKKVRDESLFIVKGDDFKISLDPLFNFGLGKYQREDIYNYDYSGKTWINTRGAILKGQIGNNVSFFTTLTENQGEFTDYISQQEFKTNVLPGEQRVKEFKNQPDVYDYESATGLVSYSPSQHFNFRFGNDKNFIGDGYRSLLLSDNTYNYPFLKMKMDFGKFEYTNIYACFQIAKYTYPNTGESTVFQKKYATMHMLSYNATDGLGISLFESTMWQARADNRVKPFELIYLNPVIGLQTAAYHLNGENNNMLGLNMHYKFLKHHCFYAQLVVDDIDLSSKGSDNNKYGYQIGYKCYNIFNVKNLCFRTEYNAVRPYTYASKDSVQSYTHNNQALADPLGANFWESITFLNYRFRSFLFELKYNYAIYSADENNIDYGGNPFLTQNPADIIPANNTIGQGLKNTLKYKTLRINYLINPATNLNIYFEITDRAQQSKIINYNSLYISFGIRTTLENYYYDF